MTELHELSRAEHETVDPRLLDVVEYRKSGLSLNHVIGCPLECAYCVRHLFGNFEMKRPHRLASTDEAVRQLTSHRFFRAHQTPIQLFNRATDPMLPGVRDETLRVAKLLDDQELENDLLIITRFHVTEDVCARLNELKHLRVTLLITHSNIMDPRIEPTRSDIAASSLKTAFALAERYRVILYWRPIVPGLNDATSDLDRAAELSASAHAVVFTGLFYRHEIAAYYKDLGLPEPYGTTTRRKILPEVLERRVLDHFARVAPVAALFRKTSCAVSYVHRRADYNGHYGVRELCDICPEEQVRRCAGAFCKPDESTFREQAEALGAQVVEVTDHLALVRGLDEARRYSLQHAFAFQVHDVDKPHLPRRHGRSEIGWGSQGSEGARTC